MSRPVRVQLSRQKGWRMPANTVVVSRPSKWGNPFDWRDWLENAPRDALPTAQERDQWAKEQATQQFADAIDSGEIVLPLEELRGRNCACWCKGPKWTCHADVLLDRANR